jgi:hypothetical protein
MQEETKKLWVCGVLVEGDDHLFSNIGNPDIISPFNTLTHYNWYCVIKYKP